MCILSSLQMLLNRFRGQNISTKTKISGQFRKCLILASICNQRYKHFYPLLDE
jgi:hypothetical protein